ncbi:rhodanese-like domain-containing protein [Hydrogenophaga sp. PAMC20947]|uniref:sulfurtransferase n=1 Tax=Hydrogenophaga sp. PAMC20947 TaxID=2565558 RepID=UPI00109DE7D0|nr:rhodanese-like domain-containing protein [Hydrogenophaga sp. PAMC20947]QCB47513.1 sulfurtransferase [Hydrogenophaga sp. PAMC20947]
MTVPPTLSLIPDGDSGHAQWRADLPRWRQLVQARWLHALLAGAVVDAAPAGAWHLFEVGEGPWISTQTPTIPGAIWLDVQRFEGGPLWNKVPDDLLLQQLAELGIRHGTTVVLAGRKRVANARAAHLLLYAGVSDVRLLDGGTQAWMLAGFPLTQDTPPKVLEPLASFGLTQPACPQFLVDTVQVRALLQQSDATLVSIRTWGEFTGRTSGYDYIAARGDIAGARWGHAGADGDVNDMSAFHTPTGLMLDTASIEALWRSQDIRTHGHTTFYCGTGWRASLAFFYAWLMGWKGISVYDGGWLEWTNDPSNPTIDRQRLPSTQPAHPGGRGSTASEALLWAGGPPPLGVRSEVGA